VPEEKNVHLKHAFFGQEAEVGKYLTPVKKSVMHFNIKCLEGNLQLAAKRMDPNFS